MSFRLRLGNISSSVAHELPAISLKRNSFQWDIEAETDSECTQITLKDPIRQSTELCVNPEEALKWYLESYAIEPFETTRADLATQILLNYGRDLAAQIVKTGLLPKNGSIRLEIGSKDHGMGTDLSCVETTLQRLHWEVLEDTKIWPSGYSFNSVSVIRYVLQNIKQDEMGAGSFQRNKFNILLVVSRPAKQKDVDYQLVSRSLVAIVDHISKTRSNIKVSLTILRPPTWVAFQKELEDHKYDLVHFDMKGRIRKTSSGHTSAGLDFCKPNHLDSLKMTKDFRTGSEIGNKLAQGGVKTAILNACDSASFEASSPESNLAEVLLRYGTQNVLAMSYKVVEEAVEIFMNAFYQSLLLNQASVEESSRIARLALINNRRRRAMFMYNVNLSDYIVPVFHTSITIPNPHSKVMDGKHHSIISSYLDKTLSSIKNLSPFEQLVTKALQSVDQAFIGRDIDILSLEFLLCTSRLVFLHGQGGCGKTELLLYVCQWWKASGWINGSAYIDFAENRSLSWGEYVEQMCMQLGLDLDEPSEAAIIDRLRSGKYLLIFDSADAFESPLHLENPLGAKEVAKSLRALIESVANDESMVIVASRLETTQVANITSQRQKFHLSGLSVLDSVILLQQLAFDKNSQPPEIYHRRDNIDFLRRIAILLEGNPTAIQMIVPALRKANYDGEALFNKLLYDKIDEPLEDIWNRSRFCTSLSIAMILPSFINFDDTMIHTTNFAPFWSIMPKDLNYYYWFFYPLASKYLEGGAAHADWISKDLHDIVNDCQMTHNLRTYWNNIELKLIHVGILQHATIIRRDSQQVPCYHINPVYTLLSRTALTDGAWKGAKSAYIRQALIWTPSKPVAVDFYDLNRSDWTCVVWDGTEQHEDLLHNRHAQAMGWANQDGDPEEQVKRMGVTLFSAHYSASIGSWWTKPRQRRLLIPHIRQNLLYAHMIVNQHPAYVPTRWVIFYIMKYSLDLYQMGAEDTVQPGKVSIVNSALEIFDRWKANSPPAIFLTPQDEVIWFQLRFAEASIMDRSFRLGEAKELFARNLADDPATTNAEILNIIRRWHLQNLQNWAACVIRLAVRDGKIDSKRFNAGIQAMSNIFKQKGIGPTSLELWSQYQEEIKSFKTGDYLSFALDLEKQAVSKFGSFAKSIIDAPMINVFADLKQENGTSFLNLLSQIWESNDTESREIKAQLGDFESGIHMMAGETAAAGRAMNFSMQREAPSSTTSTGWENLAELHKAQYRLAMMPPEKPDYKKGLTHLQEWWKLHHGVGVRKQDQVWGLLKLATCYHGLGQIAEAGREVIKCFEVGQGMGPEDATNGNIEGARNYIYKEVVKLCHLDVFLNPIVLFSQTPEIAGLSLKERLQLCQIVKTTHEVKKKEEELNKLLEEMKKEFFPFNLGSGAEKNDH